MTRDEERALVFLEAHGSTSYPPERFERWAFAITSYAPEWLTESDLGIEPDRCVTVLDYSLMNPEPPEGYRLAYQYAAGERECPWCGPGTDATAAERTACKLCDEGLIYDGEECQVVVFAPLEFVYGSGSEGCLYDGGPERAETLDQAVESLLSRFDDLGLGSIRRLERDLRSEGIHYFDRRIRPFAGADYAEITGPE